MASVSFFNDELAVLPPAKCCLLGIQACCIPISCLLLGLTEETGRGILQEGFTSGFKPTVKHPPKRWLVCLTFLPSLQAHMTA